MLFDDTYLTIEAATEGDFKDRGSKFLAYAYPIKSEQDVKPLVAALKTAHPKAVHYCWAMRLGPDRSVFRLNDDGEPSGTAGRPILNVLLSKNITNVLVVVVRYFGGTLLGVPGLINAYKTATLEALAVAKVTEKTVNDIYTIHFKYEHMNAVMTIVKDQEVEVLNQQFDIICELTIAIRKTHVNRLLVKIEDMKGVKVHFKHSA